MKKIVNLIITLGVLSGLGYVLWLGIQKQEEKEPEGDEAAAAVEEEAPPAFTVTLDKERAGALGIDKEQPQKMELQAMRRAFGTVLDPTVLVVLDGELAAAEAALSASKAENERTLALVATNDASKKTAEASQAQFLADKIKVEGLTRSAQLQWGNIFNLEASARSEFITGLTSGKIALARVEVMPGDALVEIPQRARMAVMGRETQTMVTTNILPATTTDAKSQAQGFILRVEQPPFPLRPGMALTAWLDLPEPPRPGYALPRSAVLRHDGRTWVYVQEEAETYVRKPVTLDTPLDAAQGWFVTEAGGLSADDVVVITGASSMLSEELKGSGGGEE